MKKLFNDGWSFVKTDVNCSYEEVEKLQKQRIEIPHDWLIYNTNDYPQLKCLLKNNFNKDIYPTILDMVKSLYLKEILEI